MAILALYYFTNIHLGLYLGVFFAFSFIYWPIIDKKRLKALGIYKGEGYLKFTFITRFKHYSKIMFGV
ncbi:hypothetical protein DCC35_05680 [Mangrovivirga cuniculi]|uniref:Uncharacterized protein n=1 Tax=Mangrovivirga cuniculi TaxID=2715131 RepID=A0A4D7JD77_9BACT|nr:hypothetical protein DCC35_05680 [Mangrovivirga cuniculi]